MNSILNVKTASDNFAAEYEILSIREGQQTHHAEQSILEIDAQLGLLQTELDIINGDINRLTNHADGLDYTMAAVSGILTSLIDSFVVGEWDIAEARAWSSEEINRKIIEFANKDPKYHEFVKTRKYRLDSSTNAIEFLEREYKLPGDSEWDVKTSLVRLAKGEGFEGKGYEDALKFMNETFPKEGGWGVTDTFITSKTHHLDDLCHHPTLVGLICCIIVQYTGYSIYSNKFGDKIHLPVTVNDYGKFVGHTDSAKMFSGVINWFFNCAQIIANRKGHLLSDMGGSHSSLKRHSDGMGLPGSFLSTIKELSMLQIFKEPDFAENLRRAYQNGIGTGKSQLDLGAFNALFDGARLDMRTEMAIGHELQRQSLPIIVNEVLVRAAYFIRRFIEEITKHNGFKDIEWKNIIPFNNRTIARMLTIASGTFTAVDMGDAIIRSGGVNENCLLRVNFVGVGRLVIALSVDSGMGLVKARRDDDRLRICTQMLDLHEAKIFYKEATVWREAENSYACLSLVSQTAQASLQVIADLHKQNEAAIKNITPKLRDMAKTNPTLAASLAKHLF